jgi:hypothetical protein
MCARRFGNPLSRDSESKCERFGPDLPHLQEYEFVWHLLGTQSRARPKWAHPSRLCCPSDQHDEFLLLQESFMAFRLALLISSGVPALAGSGRHGRWRKIRSAAKGGVRFAGHFQNKSAARSQVLMSKPDPVITDAIEGNALDIFVRRS